MGLLNKVTDKIGVEDKLKKTEEVGGESIREKTVEVLKALNELIPILKKNGYILDEVKIEFGISPKIKIVLDRSGEATEILESVMQQVEGDKIKVAILKSLLTINKMQDTFKKSNFTISGMDFGLSIPPAVTARIKPITGEGEI